MIMQKCDQNIVQNVAQNLFIRVVSINPHYYNDAGFKISEMRNKDYGYYLDIKVRYFDDIHADLPVTVTFRSKDFEDGIIFTSKEKAEKELEKLKGEINEERE